MPAHLPPQPSDALTVADVRYDSATLYAALARMGGALLTMPQQGLPKLKRVRRRMGPARLAAVQAWEGDAAPLARMAMRCRPGVERIFGMLTCTAGGLGPLPAWVRSLERVRRWVGVKVIIHNARLALRRRAAA